MNAEEFAKKHAGLEVVVNKLTSYRPSYWVGKRGRVVGFDSDGYVHIVCDDEKIGCGFCNFCRVVVNVATIKNGCVCFRAERLIPTLVLRHTGPDDCDTCGAKGDQECKPNCPNRNH